MLAADLTDPQSHCTRSAQHISAPGPDAAFLCNPLREGAPALAGGARQLWVRGSLAWQTLGCGLARGSSMKVCFCTEGERTLSNFYSVCQINFLDVLNFGHFLFECFKM